MSAVAAVDFDAPALLVGTPWLKPVGVVAENVPLMLRELPQWVVWQLEDGPKGRPTKVPYQAAAIRRKASSTDPATWSSFDDALAAYQANTTQLDGIGFVLTPEPGIVGIDIDH